MRLVAAASSKFTSRSVLIPRRSEPPMPIRVLLSDDEALARERLRSLLQEEPDLEIVAECGDGKSAISTIKREKPDLVFLDIQMPEVDGFGVVAALGAENMPLTIFVTAYDRYAMKAFEVH